MSSNDLYTMITFPKEAKALYDWFASLDTRVSRSKVGRELFEIARRFDGNLQTASTASDIAAIFNGSLAEAQAARVALDLQRQNNTGENNNA